MQLHALLLHLTPALLERRHDVVAAGGEVELGRPHPAVFAITKIAERRYVLLHVFADARHRGRRTFAAQPVLTELDQLRVNALVPNVVAQQGPDDAEVLLVLVPHLVRGGNVGYGPALAHVHAPHGLLQLV